MAVKKIVEHFALILITVTLGVTFTLPNLVDYALTPMAKKEEAPVRSYKHEPKPELRRLPPPGYEDRALSERPTPTRPTVPPVPPQKPTLLETSGKIFEFLANFFGSIIPVFTGCYWAYITGRDVLRRRKCSLGTA